MSIYQEYSLDVPKTELALVQSPRFVGLECEIESVFSHGQANFLGWTIVEDHSLRNNGKEYITAPIRIPTAVEAFKALHATIKCIPEEKFSSRTSIHVHVNCMAYEPQQVKNIILMYALYEEAFFLMVESDRRDNIHCVPLTETYLPRYYRDTLHRCIEKWSKYTALNIRPLTEHGTIEFRHMHGHEDVDLMREWLSCKINKLFDVGVVRTINKEFLTEENMERTFKEIFKDTRLADHWIMVRGLMTNQIIDLKLSVL